MDAAGSDLIRRLVWLVGLVFVCASLGVVVACGGDDSSSGDETSGAADVEEAQSLVAAAEEAVTQGPPGPDFDASGVSGKKIWFVSLALAIPYSQQVWQGVQDSAQALGMEAKSFDGKFSPAEVSRGIDLAVQDQADAIIVHSLPPVVVAPALAKAAEAGVKLISAETQNPGPPLPDVPDTIDAIAGHSYSIPTEAMAAQVVADSEGDANVLFLSVSDIGPGSGQGTDAFVAKMKELCPACPVEVVDSPVAQWSGLNQRVSSLLRSRPDVNYIVPIFDGMAVYIVPGIQAAGLADEVSLVSGDATPSVLENLRDGNIVIGDVGQPNVWTGWAIVDQTARVLVGEPTLEDVGLQYRLFTANNVGDLDLNGNPTEWYGDVDFEADYRAIWGVE